MRHTGNRIGGSNPSLSAKPRSPMFASVHFAHFGQRIFNRSPALLCSRVFAIIRVSGADANCSPQSGPEKLAALDAMPTPLGLSECQVAVVIDAAARFLMSRQVFAFAPRPRT